MAITYLKEFITCKSSVLLIMLLSFFVPASVSLAHGLGVTNQKAVGDYILEFEYDTTGKVIAGELTAFAFELLTNSPTHDQVPYERVSVKFTKQDGLHPVFVANLLPVDVLGRKSSRANITIPVEGSYMADLVFYNNSLELARASFPFEVQLDPAAVAPEKNSVRQSAYISIFIVLVIIIVTETIWLLKKKKT